MTQPQFNWPKMVIEKLTIGHSKRRNAKLTAGIFLTVVEIFMFSKVMLIRHGAPEEVANWHPCVCIIPFFHEILHRLHAGFGMRMFLSVDSRMPPAKLLSSPPFILILPQAPANLLPFYIWFIIFMGSYSFFYISQKSNIFLGSSIFLVPSCGFCCTIEVVVSNLPRDCSWFLFWLNGLAKFS